MTPRCEMCGGVLITARDGLVCPRRNCPDYDAAAAATVTNPRRSVRARTTPPGGTSTLQTGVSTIALDNPPPRSAKAAKCCSVCGNEMSLEHFYADRTHGDGLSSRCKACCDARDRTEHDRRKYQRRKQRQTPGGTSDPQPIAGADPADHARAAAKFTNGRGEQPREIPTEGN